MGLIIEAAKIAAGATLGIIITMIAISVIIWLVVITITMVIETVKLFIEKGDN